MTDALEIRPVITAALAHRTASSDCCGVKLDPGLEPGTFTCQACGEPCGRVMSEPREITARSS